VSLIGGKVVLKNAKGRMLKIPREQLSGEDLEFIQLEMPPDLDISFSKQSTQRVYPESLGTRRPTMLRYVFSAKIKQMSTKSYDHELQAEIFVIGAEIGGDNYILLDRQQHAFTLNKENQRFGRLSSGKTVEVIDYLLGNNTIGLRHRGMKYASYLVVITDSRGKIIAHETPKKWLFKNLENLREVPVGKCIDKTCNRIAPTPPKRYY